MTIKTHSPQHADLYVEDWRGRPTLWASFRSYEYAFACAEKLLEVFAAHYPAHWPLSRVTRHGDCRSLRSLV